MCFYKRNFATITRTPGQSQGNGFSHCNGEPRTLLTTSGARLLSVIVLILATVPCELTIRIPIEPHHYTDGKAAQYTNASIDIDREIGQNKACTLATYELDRRSGIGPYVRTRDM